MLGTDRLLLIVEEGIRAKIYKCLPEMFLAQLLVSPEVIVIFFNRVHAMIFFFKFFFAHGRINFDHFFFEIEWNPISTPVDHALFNFLERKCLQVLEMLNEILSHLVDFITVSRDLLMEDT